MKRAGSRSDLRRLQLALVVLAVPNLVTGVWALVWPSSWYADFPGKGLGWVMVFGDYNEHLIQDIGGAYLAFGSLLLYTALRPSRSLIRGALLGFLVFAVPHFLIHVFVREELSTAGYFGTLMSLGLGIALALWALTMNRKMAESGPAPG